MLCSALCGLRSVRGRDGCDPFNEWSCCHPDAPAEEDDPFVRVEIEIQKVVLQRRSQDVSLVSWLLGQRREIFVEVQEAGIDSPPQRTQDAPIQAASGNNAEVWLFNAEGNKSSSLAVELRSSSQLVIRVFGIRRDGGAAWFQAAEPAEEELCQGRFTPMWGCHGVAQLPLLQDGKKCGMVSMTVSSPPLNSVSKRWDSRGSDQMAEEQVSSLDRDEAGGQDPGDLGKSVRLEGHRAPVVCVAVFPEGSRVLTGSQDTTSIVWSVQGELLHVLRGHTSAVLHCAILTEEQVLTCEENGDGGIIWSVEKEQQLVALPGARFCEVHVDGRLILAAVEASNAAIFGTEGKMLAVLHGHTDRVTTCKCFPDGRMLTASADSDAIIWSPNGEKRQLLRGHSAEIVSCDVFPDGSRVVTASNDMTGIIWVPESSDVVAVLRGHTARIFACAVLCGGEAVLTVSEDTRGILWSSLGEQLADLLHSSAVLACSILDPGTRVLTVCRDGACMVWQCGTDSAQQMCELRGHAAPTVACTASARGNKVVTASSDCSAIVWDLGPTPGALACQVGLACHSGAKLVFEASAASPRKEQLGNVSSVSSPSRVHRDGSGPGNAIAAARPRLTAPALKRVPPAPLPSSPSRTLAALRSQETDPQKSASTTPVKATAVDPDPLKKMPPGTLGQVFLEASADSAEVLPETIEKASPGVSLAGPSGEHAAISGTEAGSEPLREPADDLPPSSSIQAAQADTAASGKASSRASRAAQVRERLLQRQATTSR